MGSGKEYRLGRLFGQDGRAMILPVDHGLAYGRIEGLEKIQEVIADGIDANCDGLLMGLGATRASVRARSVRNAPAVLLSIDLRLGAEGDRHGKATIMNTVEQAVRNGCHVAKVLMPWDNDPEEQVNTVSLVTEIIRQGEQWDMPVLVEPVALRAEASAERTAVEITAARIAVELGADILKMRYTGEQDSFAQLCDELEVPIVLLGGPGANTYESVIQMTSDSLEAGGAGVSIGRQLWQRPPAVRQAMMRALVKLVHREIDVEAAIEEVRSAS